MKKKDRIVSYTLRNAGKLMEEAYHNGGDGRSLCCPTISIAARNNSRVYFKTKEFFRDWFMPKKAKLYWFGLPYEPENTEVRILLLYLAAHIAYSEGL